MDRPRPDDLVVPEPETPSSPPGRDADERVASPLPGDVLPQDGHVNSGESHVFAWPPTEAELDLMLALPIGAPAPSEGSEAGGTSPLVAADPSPDDEEAAWLMLDEAPAAENAEGRLEESVTTGAAPEPPVSTRLAAMGAPPVARELLTAPPVARELPTAPGPFTGEAGASTVTERPPAFNRRSTDRLPAAGRAAPQWSLDEGVKRRRVAGALLLTGTLLWLGYRMLTPPQDPPDPAPADPPRAVAAPGGNGTR